MNNHCFIPFHHTDSQKRQSLNEMYPFFIPNNKRLCIDLSPLKLFHVYGDDAHVFLQGQLSNNIDQLSQNNSQLHAYCNQKGRVISIMRIMKNNCNFWMLIHKDISQHVISRLKMFILKEKVTIESSDDHTAFCAAGQAGITAQFSEHCHRYNVDGIVPRQIIVVPNESSHRIFKEGFWEYCDHSVWRFLDIQSGIPQIFCNTIEIFLPQMINLDLVNGISFQKGCYPGQEIVARLRYLGQLKRRMMIGEVDNLENISPGDKIMFYGKLDQRSGIVVDTVQTGDHRSLISIVVPTIAFSEGQIKIDNDHTVIHPLPLPYPFPEEDPDN